MATQKLATRNEPKFESCSGKFETKVYIIEAHFLSDPDSEFIKNRFHIVSKYPSPGGQKDEIVMDVYPNQSKHSPNVRSIDFIIELKPNGNTIGNSGFMKYRDHQSKEDIFNEEFRLLSQKPEKLEDRLMEIIDIYISTQLRGMSSLKASNLSVVSKTLEAFQIFKDDVKDGEIRLIEDTTTDAESLKRD
ncbi:MAG: hypothetical protein ABR981_02655 [Candidatus Micrarchaeaceae archaeon]|jgi:hypothetical protein